VSPTIDEEALACVSVTRRLGFHAEVSTPTLETILDGGGGKCFLEIGVGQQPLQSAFSWLVIGEISRSGGKEVIVDGKNFLNSTNLLSCRFGSVSSKAHYISPDKIICM
jgi:hypothetical protein